MTMSPTARVFRRSLRGCSLLLPLVLAACSAQPQRAIGHASHGVHLASQERAQLDLANDPADLRPQARTVLRQLQKSGWRLPPVARLPMLTTLPPTIRVWRRSQGGSKSCDGPVDVIPLEDYVKGVLPHEWYPSWEMASLRAGAVAIRSFAAAFVLTGGKYDCADVCDTTYSQVYKDETFPRTNQAIDDTKGTVLLDGSGSIVLAMYGNENGDPTKSGVSDPVCAGKAAQGHGHGMCQWGSQRWALQGKGYKWIAPHYYPGATLFTAGAVVPDAAPVMADVAPPTQDQTAAVQDAALPPDASLPARDRGLENEWVGLGASPALQGGCAMGHGAVPAGGLALLLLASLLLMTRWCHR